MRHICSTTLGDLYQGDCLELLCTLPSESVHAFFADPPFNLRKNYGRSGSDDRPASAYLEWSRQWLREAVRVLMPGGALFVYNLPKWLMPFGCYLNSLGSMTFKHWIAIDKAHSLPIPNRLSPRHYGLLYYIKGEKPRCFDRDAVRLPIKACRHCGKDVKDYGGHRKHLNPLGLNLGDVWADVPPVRHSKYKNRTANELAPVILERIILLSTCEGDTIVDPFVGAGTTAYVAQKLNRRWICSDLNSCTAARDRLREFDQVDRPADQLSPELPSEVTDGRGLARVSQSV